MLVAADSGAEIPDELWSIYFDAIRSGPKIVVMQIVGGGMVKIGTPQWRRGIKAVRESGIEGLIVTEHPIALKSIQAAHWLGASVQATKWGALHVKLAELGLSPAQVLDAQAELTRLRHASVSIEELRASVTRDRG